MLTQRNQPEVLAAMANGSVPSVTFTTLRQVAMRPAVSVPDWTRENCHGLSWQPARQLLRTVRRYQALAGKRGLVVRLLRKALVLRHRFWSVVAGAEIPLNCVKLGGGLLLPHPAGVVIHPDACIGDNCLIMQQVTIGTGSRPGLPRIGSNVNIYAGAKVLGGVLVGDGAEIGANAVVVRDVPPNCVAVGVPAMVRKKR